MSDTLILSRQVFTDQSTLGELCIDGEHACWTLEPSARARGYGIVCIPAGKYEIQMLWSTKFKMDTPHVLNVPGRTFIEVHPGNYPKDTEGCILPGETKEENCVSNSRKAYGALVKKIEAKLAQGKCWIEIIGGSNV